MVGFYSLLYHCKVNILKLSKTNSHFLKVLLMRWVLSSKYELKRMADVRLFSFIIDRKRDIGRQEI